MILMGKFNRKKKFPPRIMCGFHLGHLPKKNYLKFSFNSFQFIFYSVMNIQIGTKD